MWSDAEKQFLRDNAASMTAKELVSEIWKQFRDKKTPEATRGMCRSMGFLPKVDERNRWTKTELDFLSKNRHRRVKELSKHLGRGEKAITVKIHSQGFLYGRMERVTPWMTTMVENIPGKGKSIYDISTELHQAGRKVEIESNGQKEMAVFCRERGKYVKEMDRS